MYFQMYPSAVVNGDVLTPVGFVVDADALTLNKHL
jgi:hypothetical protein